jgi:murein L,D-transpeptidase YafK
VAVLALAWPSLAVAPASAVSIELNDVASDRIERQRAAAEGRLPLPDTPDVSRLDERLAAAGVKLGAPILIRAFKSESELEVWIEKDGAFVLFATYPVCHWSGTLGPKLREGDKQTPEGFYTVTRPQMRRLGRWPRSLDLAFPNAYDKSYARTGSVILIHGGCSSVGCFAMTNAVMEEIHLIAERAVRGGQQLFVPVHVYPFRMTADNLASQKDSPWYDFWSNLKEGYDLFERTRRPPRIATCEGRYTFGEIAPEEGADAGPLAVCGETFAAVTSQAHLSPSALALLSARLNPPVSAPRSLPAHRHLHSHRRVPPRPNPSGPGADPSAVATSARPTWTATRAPCSMQRASCRHFMATRGAAERRRALAAERRLTAPRTMAKRR